MTHAGLPELNAPDAQFAALVDERYLISDRGGSRRVYALPAYPKFVLKVTRLESNATNWTEILLYSIANNDQRESLAAIETWS